MRQQRWTIAFAPLDEGPGEGPEKGMYEVTVRRTGSVHRFKAKLPPDISDLWTQESQSTEGTRQFRSGIETMAPDAQFFGAGNLPTLKEIGERIMDATLDVNSGREGIKVLGALEDRVASSGGIELQFDLSRTPELQGIPWEAAYLKSKDRFLAIGTTSNVVRKLDAQSDLPDPIERPIRILVAAANPLKDLDTEVELGNITRRVEELIAGGKDDFEVRALHATTRDQFRNTVRDWKPHIIHYIGHSAFKDGSGYLYFESEGADDKSSDKVSAETLRNILQNWRPWVVVLNSCESGKTSLEHPMGGVAQDLLGRINIPFVVGMQKPVSDEAAIAFSQDFYAALTGGETIANAVTLGRNAISTQADFRTQLELITPALYTSGETDRIAFAATGAIAGAVAAGSERSGGAEDSGWSGKAANLLKGPTGLLLALTAFVTALEGMTDAVSNGWNSARNAISGADDDRPEPPNLEQFVQTSSEKLAAGTGSFARTLARFEEKRLPDTQAGQPPRQENVQNVQQATSNVMLSNISAPARRTSAAGAGISNQTVPTGPEEQEQPVFGSRDIPTGLSNISSGSFVPRTRVLQASAAQYTPPISDEARLQMQTPPALERVEATSGGVNYSSENYVYRSENYWSDTVASYPIPYCAGTRAQWYFTQNTAAIDPVLSPYKEAFDIGLVAAAQDCRLASIAFHGHVTKAEESLQQSQNYATGRYDQLGLNRAQTIATKYAFLSEYLGTEESPVRVDVINLGAPFTDPSAFGTSYETADGAPYSGGPPAEPLGQRVDMVFVPKCPSNPNIVARIAFANGQTDLTIEARAQLAALGPAIEAAGYGKIGITAAPTRYGESIFKDADTRVRSVMAALPGMDGDEAPAVQPRIVGWSCPSLFETTSDTVNDVVVVELFTAQEIAETLRDPALPETDPVEQIDEPAIGTQGIEKRIIPGQY